MAALVCVSCSGRSRQKTVNVVQVPVFCADSAYAYLASQLEFGWRVPGTQGHRDCGDWLCARLQHFGAVVEEQLGETKLYDGRRIPVRNIMASFQPENTRRVLLCAHWDSRPWCDREPGAARRYADCSLSPSADKPGVMGANDGASGVAVLLEVARQLQAQMPEIGIDIVFFDAEDCGAPDWADSKAVNDWCLGAQYWAKHLPARMRADAFGILLDMVGGRRAVFMWDYLSARQARPVAEKVWSTAQALGYGHLFQNGDGGMLTDDHQYVNSLAGIPCIDIVDYDDMRGGFAESWHTAHDDLAHIDGETLQAVGQTLLQVIYNE